MKSRARRPGELKGSFLASQSMLSIKSYILGGADRDAEGAYRHVIDLIVQGIAMYAIPGEQAAYDRFRADIDRFAASITAETKPADLLATAGELMRALEEYGRSTTDFVERQNSELQNMVSMLTQTVIKIGTSSEASVANLRAIEQALSQARMLEDIKTLKLRLTQCLETVHQEAERQNTDGQSAVANLKQELTASRQRVGEVAQPKEADRVTGLPSQREAEKALRSAVASPEGKYVVVVMVNRVTAVNARFGYETGDQLLIREAEHFRSGLSKADELYRWQGPALLAILSRNTRIDEVRSEIRRFADAHLEHAVEVGNRTIRVPVTSNWAVLPPASSFEALLRKIEAFTAAQVPREYA
jgi:GGDEF domain-containing protein